MTKLNASTDAVVLIGHGSPATDCPKELVGELMRLEWRRADGSDPARMARIAELDATIRHWPRHAGNDPYKVGLERVGEALKRLLPTARFGIGYTEFCRPSIVEAVEGIIEEGARRVFVSPSMLTPGGLHSEHDIPRALAVSQAAHPEIPIVYLWPFDVARVAAMLAAHLQDANGAGVQPNVLAGT
jgi:sirohydrochlorin cobaltochelatase